MRQEILQAEQKLGHHACMAMVPTVRPNPRVQPPEKNESIA